jgi:hypothetical protein
MLDTVGNYKSTKAQGLPFSPNEQWREIPHKIGENAFAMLNYHPNNFYMCHEIKNIIFAIVKNS